MLTRWRSESQSGTDAFRGHGKLRAEEEEIRRLKKELADTQQERDILNKALAIFSKTQR